mmetsp:Transcript_2321/g.6061  ORF Transcript_2321/g.6061 Transcript_2321/m.6061 type:complete len:228 (-) Transcript_2321:68-751(-)
MNTLAPAAVDTYSLCLLEERHEWALVGVAAAGSREHDDVRAVTRVQSHLLRLCDRGRLLIPREFTRREVVDHHGKLREDRARLSTDSLVRGHHEHRARRAVLGHDPGRGSRAGDDDDELRVAVHRPARRGRRGGLERRERSLGVIPDEGDGRLGGVRELGVGGDGGHGGHRDRGVGAVGGLAGEHRGVGAVEDGICHVGHLSSRGQRVGAHGLQHLRGADAKPSGDV